MVGTVRSTDPNTTIPPIIYLGRAHGTVIPYFTTKITSHRVRKVTGLAIPR